MGVTPEEVMLIATGTEARSILPLLERKFIYEGNLTLEGLYFIYKNNKQI